MCDKKRIDVACDIVEYHKVRMRSQGPKSKSLELQFVQSLLLRAWKLGFSTSQGVSSPKYGMDAYLTTLFRGEAWDLC